MTPRSLPDAVSMGVVAGLLAAGAAAEFKYGGPEVIIGGILLVFAFIFARMAWHELRPDPPQPPGFDVVRKTEENGGGGG